MMDKRDDTARQAALDGEAWLNRQAVFLEADRRGRAFADELVQRVGTVWLEGQDAALEAERRKKSVGGPP
jgi:hypothetical protein